MSDLFSIVMPACRAEQTIAASVKSVVDQTLAGWELLVVSDDGTDYEAVLGRAGLADPRIRYLSTGKTGSGSANARNCGLDAAEGRFAALLDADDRFHPRKLSLVAPTLMDHPLASCALCVMSDNGATLRTVGAGESGVLSAGAYKHVNISMDSMIAYDRRAVDPRVDTSLPCLTDLDLVMRLLAATGECFHHGKVLHDYVKQPVSVSNGPGVAARMIATKKLMLARLADGGYAMPPEGVDGLSAFLRRSLAAEKTYEAALAARPGLLFEDHLEGYLSEDGAPGGPSSGHASSSEGAKADNAPSPGPAARDRPLPRGAR